MGFIASVLLVARPQISASASSLIPARTGGFGEMTCHQCHWENPLDEPSGRLTLEGIPETYTPGEQYPITVMLARPRISRAGFQLAAREDGINMNSGSDAGVLLGTDSAVETVQDERKRVTYAQHSASGTQMRTPGIAAWKVIWTAPDHEAPVVFHVAANAANDDDSPLGDFIYTAIVRSRPE